MIINLRPRTQSPPDDALGDFVGGILAQLEARPDAMQLAGMAFPVEGKGVVPFVGLRIGVQHHTLTLAEADLLALTMTLDDALPDAWRMAERISVCARSAVALVRDRRPALMQFAGGR